MRLIETSRKREIPMNAKILAVLVLTFALAGCPGPTPGGSTLPTDKGDCFTLVKEPGVPAPEPQPWTGELPNASADAIWVISPVDSQGAEWVVTPVNAERAAVEAVVVVKRQTLPEIREKLDIREAITIQLGLKVLSIWRPNPPPPGPPGFPPGLLRRAVNVAMGFRDVVIKDQRLEDQVGRVDVTH